MTLEPWQWVLVIFGALMVGLAKTGLAGLGILFVAILANVLPTKQSSGFVLPLLIFGDVVAVAIYRQHAQWHHLWRLFPWTAAGVFVGYLAMGRIDDRQASVLIGAIVVTMVAMHVARRRRAAKTGIVGQVPVSETQAWWFAPAMGVLAGFTTLVANAAGPLMAMYLLAMRLPKMEYVGTAAVFFLLLNVFKVPFMAHLGLVTRDSVTINLILAPAVLGGAFLGRMLLKKIDQRLFENLVLALSAIAGMKLIF